MLQDPGGKTLILFIVVMVNVMWPLGWATVLRYVVKHFSGCLCESVLDVINI